MADSDELSSSIKAWDSLASWI